jgi:uncharacterized protein
MQAPPIVSLKPPSCGSRTERNPMRTILFTIALLFTLTLALPARAEDPAITTTGTATVYAVPDKAVFSVTLSNIDPDITKACAKNNADAEKLVKAVKDAGIAQDDIATNTLSLSPHYRRIPGTPSGESERDGFTAARNYSVTLKDLKQIEKLFTAMVNSGVEAMPSVSLEVTNTRPYRDQARALALKAAQEKAVAMAKELNATVGKPHTILEGTTNTSSPYRNVLASNSITIAADRPTPDTPESTPIGKIQIQATVTVTFDLK